MSKQKKRQNIVVTDKSSPLFDELDYKSSCTDKKTYTTPYDAQYAVDIAQSCDYMLHLSYYKCPYCKNYHLTST